MFSVVCAFALWIGFETLRRDIVRGPCRKARSRWSGFPGHSAGAALFVSLTVTFQTFLPHAITQRPDPGATAVAHSTATGTMMSGSMSLRLDR